VKRVAFDGASLITPAAIEAELASTSKKFKGESLPVAKAHLALLLSLAQQRFEKGNAPARIIHELAGQLHQARERFPVDVWQALIPIAQEHPVAEYFLQDPFTRWSFEKPRGYSGDAQLLDFIYGHKSVDADVTGSTELGRALYDYTKDASSSVAVRERRDLLTKYVDEIAAAHGADTEILTVAAGHLREADRSTALREGRIKRWVALDQDPGLLDYAFSKRVLLASPVSFWATLKTVAFTWQQEVLTEDAKRLFDLGKELFGRIATLGEHADKLRRSLDSTVANYNQFASSLESRVLVTARKLDQLDESKIIPTPGLVEERPKPLSAIEFELATLDELEGVARPELQLPGMELPSPAKGSKKTA